MIPVGGISAEHERGKDYRSGVLCYAD